jgi:hypothetical protein
MMIMKVGSIPSNCKPSLNLVLINYHPAIILNADLIEYITAPDNLLIPIPL